jgi:NADPH-dependent glutamate synthase beta subunit-like oxidoreductase
MGPKLRADLTIAEEKDFSIAIIGGGPAGMMAAYDLRKLGYRVTIFEAMPVLGGMMAKSIPAFRLPRNVLTKETQIIEKLGVDIKLNTRVGDDIAFSSINDQYDAVFIAVGAHRGRDIDLENANAEGVIDGIGFLGLINAGAALPSGDKVVIIGGGNAAIDCARASLRLGFKDVKIVYRRSRSEMPAIAEEVTGAEQEGVQMQFQVNPSRIIVKEGKVSGIECIRTKLGEPDESGRRRPISVAGSEFILETDLLVVAIGERPDLQLLEEVSPSIVVNDRIIVNPVTLETGTKGIFAGGDAVTGPADIIHALAAGRKAAVSIDRYLNGKPLDIGRESESLIDTRLKVSTEGITRKVRVSMSMLSPDLRKNNFNEVVSGFSLEEAKEEAGRCLNCECGICVDHCQFLKMYCQTPKELAEKFKADSYKEEKIVPYSCNLCNLCQHLCPEDLCLSDMCLEIRQKMVKEGIGPLTEHELVKEDQEVAKSDDFALAKPDPGDKISEWVFFPGCSLSAYSPELVVKLYNYVKERLPGTGIILNCCGAPTHCLGEHAKFDDMLNNLEIEVKKLGASGVLVACPDCHRTIKYNSPGLKIKSVYDLIVEHGLPESAFNSGDDTFSLHDSCTARGESGFIDSVRNLVKQMGYKIEEMEYSGDKTRCCGAGGMVPYVDLELYFNLAEQRANEAPFDMLSYCATCRETFASVGKESIHILDLIFNPDWKNGLYNPPIMGKPSVRNRLN